MSIYELDNLYKTTVSKLPKEQRIWYCTRHLDKLQFIFENNEKKMKPSQVKNMEKMMVALKDEIKILEKLDK